MKKSTWKLSKLIHTYTQFNAHAHKLIYKHTLSSHTHTLSPRLILIHVKMTTHTHIIVAYTWYNDKPEPYVFVDI